MIIKSKHHIFYYNWFRLYYAKWKVRRNFHEVTISGDFQEKNLPILLISNHVSWWDGIWAMYLNLVFFKRKFHFMMLEDQIKQFPVCNKVGGYSIKRGSRSMVESMQYTAELLADNRNMVLIFPQGDIQSIYNHTILFEKGLEHIMKKIGGRVQIIFMASLVDYYSNPKPGLFIYFREYCLSDTELTQIQHDYNAFYSQSIEANIQKAGQ
jgi:1-acyl-sn-glycerol-3-phosphate acyltransferase